MSKSKSKGMYSWWWESHNTSKGSKWLQENLTDMDSKVKSMIKLIEEDADSFAKRAEMYYKNRPELMKYVEEFYRAYRSLAERYDDIVHRVQKTIKADEDISFSSDFDDKEKNPEVNLQHTKEEDESEIEKLKKALADMIAEKDELFCQYQFSLEKLSNADEELNHVVEKSRILAETASGAEKEAHKLKETLRLLLAEKESGSNKQMEYLQTISEAKTQDLMDKLPRLESESDAGLLKYGKRMEEKIMKTEETPKMSSEKKFIEEMEVDELKNALLKLSEEKEALQVLYSESLEKSYKLEVDLSSSQSHVEHLTNEIINSKKEVKNVEEICVHLEKSNESLKMEVSDLAKKFMLKDREVSDKHDELEKHQGYAKDKHTHYAQFEASIEALKMLYTRSLEEQRNIAVELKKGLEMMNDLEECKTRLEQEMKQVKEDNENLKKSETEFMGLKQKLEGEVALQLGQSAAMQEEICNLKDEITKLKELQLVNESNRAG